MTNICNENTLKIFRFLSITINVLFIIVPIILVIVCSIDLIKYLINKDNINIKLMIKRIIVGLIIFFVIPLVRFIIGLTGLELENICMECFINYNSKICVEKLEKQINDQCGYELKSNECCSKKYNKNGYIYKYNELSETCDRIK